MGIFSRLKKLFSRERKLGIAFGSGGAKGMAHLGALRAFEEAGISFSFVAGSSIGSIVGALYAKGYTSSDMVQVIENINRREFSKNLRPFTDMAFAEHMLEPYLEGDFSTLSLPFAAWATDGATNEGVRLDSGKLTRALAASSAMPPFFRGVEIGNRRLYDGAFTNAVPADVCRDMGADFVIGIDLSAFPKEEEEKTAVARLFGAAKLKFSPVLNKITPVKNTEDCKTRGYASADFMLRPDLRDFRATDVSREAMAKMFEIGYEEAKANMAAIKKAIGKCPRRRKRA